MIRRLPALIAGIAAMALVLVHPLEEWAEQYLWIHMIAHEILIFIAAPLLAFALVPGVAAAPAPFRSLVGLVTTPAAALIISTIALWIWHLPAAYDLALEREPVHALEHGTFVAGFVCFWWPLLDGRLGTAASRVIYLMIGGIQGAVLGALIAFHGSVLYPFYASTPRALDPLIDQQRAGMVMLLSGAVVYLLAAVLASGPPYKEALA